jgi:hypothetical protein
MRTGDRVPAGAHEQRALADALELLAPAGDAGPSAWTDVLRRAAALPACRCRARGLDPAGGCAFPIPVRRP